MKKIFFSCIFTPQILTVHYYENDTRDTELNNSHQHYAYDPPPNHAMSTTTALHTRLKELSAALGQIHPLVNRLRNFTTSVGQGDEARLELGTEIHGMLKDAEEQMELLRVEVEALQNGMENKRKGLGSEKEEERERVVMLAGRLVEDLRR